MVCRHRWVQERTKKRPIGSLHPFGEHRISITRELEERQVPAHCFARKDPLPAAASRLLVLSGRNDLKVLNTEIGERCLAQLEDVAVLERPLVAMEEPSPSRFLFVRICLTPVVRNLRMPRHPRHAMKRERHASVGAGAGGHAREILVAGVEAPGAREAGRRAREDGMRIQYRRGARGRSS